MPSKVTPRGFIDAARTALPVRIPITTASDDPPAHDCGENFVLRGANPENADDAVDNGQDCFSIAGEEISDELLEYDAPQQRRG
jgi:hypothetical protein